jgi:hypothetical protein
MAQSIHKASCHLPSAFLVKGQWGKEVRFLMHPFSLPPKVRAVLQPTTLHLGGFFSEPNGALKTSVKLRKLKIPFFKNTVNSRFLCHSPLQYQ